MRVIERRRRRRVEAREIAEVTRSNRSASGSAPLERRDARLIESGIDDLDLLETLRVSNCVATLPPNAAPAACAACPRSTSSASSFLRSNCTEISGARCVPLLLTLVAPGTLLSRASTRCGIVGRVAAVEVGDDEVDRLSVAAIAFR